MAGPGRGTVDAMAADFEHAARGEGEGANGSPAEARLGWLMAMAPWRGG